MILCGCLFIAAHDCCYVISIWTHLLYRNEVAHAEVSLIIVRFSPVTIEYIVFIVRFVIKLDFRFLSLFYFVIKLSSAL